MRHRPQIRIVTLLLLVLVAALIISLNVRESLLTSGCYYAPLFDGTLPVARHSPPYHIKEMAIDYHVEQGWPVWHARSTYSYRAHNAGWDFVDGRPPTRRPKQINWQRLGMNVASWIGMLVLTGILAEMLLSGFRRAGKTSVVFDKRAQRNATVN